MRTLDQEDDEEDDVEIDLDILPDNSSDFGFMPKVKQVKRGGCV